MHSSSLGMPSHAPPICSPVESFVVLASPVVVGVPDVVMLDGSSDVDGESVVVLSVVASPGLQAMTRIARSGMVNLMAAEPSTLGRPTTGKRNAVMREQAAGVVTRHQMRDHNQRARSAPNTQATAMAQKVHATRCTKRS